MENKPFVYYHDLLWFTIMMLVVYMLFSRKDVSKVCVGRFKVWNHSWSQFHTGKRAHHSSRPPYRQHGTGASKPRFSHEAIPTPIPTPSPPWRSGGSNNHSPTCGRDWCPECCTLAGPVLSRAPWCSRQKPVLVAGKNTSIGIERWSETIWSLSQNTVPQKKCWPEKKTILPFIRPIICMD